MAKLSNLKYSSIGINIDNKANIWCKVLVKHFKKQPSMIFVRLTSKKYTVKNVRNQQKSAKYLQAITRHAKGANINAVYNQLIFAYENITAKL